MIRIGLECALVFMLPAITYLGWKFMVGELADMTTGKPKPMAEVLDEAPLVWLFALGCILLAGTLMTFATLQDQNIDKPYVPAILKDGRIQQGPPN